MRMPSIVLGAVFVFASLINPAAAGSLDHSALQMTQAAGAAPAAPPSAAEQRMQARFPQPVRVGDLIGLPVVDDNERTIGFVRRVVRTPQDKIQLIVSCGGWFGWGTRSVAVPIEVVGIAGQQLASLDMPRSDYAVAPSWQDVNAASLSKDDSIRVALARH
jgi:hypothetical protein